MSQDLPELFTRLTQVRRASRELALAPSAQKNETLSRLSQLLHTRAQDVLKANGDDLAACKRIEGMTSAFQDRLTLTDDRLQSMRASLEQVVKLSDPVGEVIESKTLPNGLFARRMRSPLGVIFMIFESRPNVAIEAFSLGFKSGNAMILRGGKESLRTVTLLGELVQEALRASGLPAESVWVLENSDRAWVEFLLKQDRQIDLVVPRGGESLIRYVAEHTRIPIIRNDRGMCHVYVDASADLEMALRVVVNAKTQRPGVCNAMETVLVHEQIASQLLPQLHEAMKSKNVEWFACPRSLAILAPREGVHAAQSESFDTEYLDLKINARVVTTLDEALRHIEEHGSRHSEAIITTSVENAKRFEREVDAAAVYWNASTRFTDGFELGLGGELGISTQKLHVRGPVGLRELTSVRWILEGQGQIRG